MTLPQSIIFWSATAAQAMLAVAMVVAAFRLFRGPRAQDRIVAIDMIYNLALLQLLVLSVKTGNPIYFPVIAILAVIGFVSSVALAKFLMRGEVIE